MWAVYVSTVVTVMFFIWQMNERRMARLGRGWFLRNWLALFMAGLVGLALTVMFSADAPFWNLLGFVMSASVLYVRFNPPAAVVADDGAEIPVSATDPKKIVTGKRLDKVQFDYTNADGAQSARRVLVQMCGEWQFEGIDLDKGAERTFRYDRVVGNIQSEETGEALDPQAWGSTIRKLSA